MWAPASTAARAADASSAAVRGMAGCSAAAREPLSATSSSCGIRHNCTPDQDRPRPQTKVLAFTIELGRSRCSNSLSSALSRDAQGHARGSRGPAWSSACERGSAKRRPGCRTGAMPGRTAGYRSCRLWRGILKAKRLTLRPESDRNSDPFRLISVTCTISIPLEDTSPDYGELFAKADYNFNDKFTVGAIAPRLSWPTTWNESCRYRCRRSRC